MNDQAARLRRLVKQDRNVGAKVISVVSGKGGVGKSNVCLNFAISLAKQGERVLILDLDIGMANLDILMGLHPKYNIMDLFTNNLSIWDLIDEGEAGVSYIAGGSGFSTLIELNDDRMERFFTELERIGPHFDYIFMDMGAGATKSGIEFVLASDDVFIVTTPEPPAITDAYAMMKYIHVNEKEKPLYLIVNRAESTAEAKRTLTSFSNVALQFLQKEVIQLGFIPFDRVVRKAVIAQKPFITMNRRASASKAVEQLVSSYIGNEDRDKGSSFNQFMSRIRRLFKDKR